MSQTRATTNYLVEATINSRFGGFEKRLRFLTVNEITGLVPDQRLPRSSFKLPKNKPLADPEFDQPAPIDMLIGSGPTLAALCVGQIKLSSSGEPDLYMQNTRYGWATGGSAPQKDPHESINSEQQCLVTNLADLMDRFWKIEEISTNEKSQDKKAICEEHFLKYVQRDDTGRYVVALPFITDEVQLGRTREMAEKRLLSIERKLERNSELKIQYHKVLDEYLALGHMSLVTDENNQRGFYLPHHAVFKESSLTTKVRVVFDGSAKSSTGISLNEALMVGPTIQDNIFSLLLRFRTHNYVLTGDIEKMYRQFWIREEDRVYQKILWRNAQGEIVTYQLNTVTFGLSPAPFLAIRCLHQLAADEGTTFPEAAKIVKRDLYVDDLLTGTATFQEALSLRNEITQLLQRGQLNIRQWASNDPRLLDGLPISHVNLKIHANEDNTIKTLGIHWNSEHDAIVYTVHPVSLLNGRITKRVILSDIARIFDPLGLLGPVITYAKIIMQRLWLERVGWDESIPLYIFSDWSKYISQLPQLNNISFARNIAGIDCKDIQIHGFCDASEKAYGACIYVRSTDINGKITSTLWCAKSRVAPLKQTKTDGPQEERGEQINHATIPRLELCAAQLLTNLYITVRNATSLTPSKVVCWSDSTIVLHWIKTATHRLKPFVANRVQDIQSHSTDISWRHVRTHDNPADLISRGQTPSEFIAPSIWQHGPKWILQDEEHWPNLDLPSLSELPESRQVRALVSPIDCDILTRYSSIVKLRRIIAYLRRFKTKYKGPLLCEELLDADICIVKLVQAYAFADELRKLRGGCSVDKNSKLKMLNPFLDDHSVIRVGGRLRNAVSNIDEKHPIVLPSKHMVTELLIVHEHARHLHAGTQATLYALRRKYWILDGRNQVRKWIRKCIRCHHTSPSTMQCQMGDLPRVRVTEARPFTNVGVDYCGPFFIKEKKFRNRGRIKIYVAVFVCLTVKAVHLELVSDMTTEAFLAALKRFIARRGMCRSIYSDNGTNFIGANNELNEIAKLLRSKAHNEILQKWLTDQGINWHFMPPQSPNFGGIWEAAVKSFKHHFKRVIGDVLFTFEELNTFIIEIEAILNSRPLTPLSSDPNDILVLTPGHFLIGNALSSLPEVDFGDTPSNRLSTWHHIQKVKQDFWKRWHREYLSELNNRQKWTHGSPNIQLGTLVLIKEDNQPPLRWPMGRVVETMPGADGIIRVVRLKTARGVYVRNVRRLAPLPVDNKN